MADMTEVFTKQNQETEQKNPFNVILGRWNEAEARRLKENEERRKEEADLKKSLMGLQYEYNYRKELEKFQTEESNKREFGKAILSGGLTKIPQKQVATAGGRPVFEEETIQGAPQEEGEVSFKGTPFEAIAGKQKFKRNTQGSLDDFKKELEVKKLLREERASTPEGQREKAVQKGEAEAIGKSIEMSEKMATAVRRLALINRQFKEALPTGDKTPLEQRIAGKAMGLATKFGFVDNPKLLALKKNVRPMAINLIRLFGEVGNLSQTEQQGAIDIVNQEGLTEKERIASTKQFIEYALVGAPPDAKNLLKKQKDIQGILNSFGVDLFTETGQQAQSVNSKTKAQRANEIAQANPGLSREQIIQRVNQEFNQ